MIISAYQHHSNCHINLTHRLICCCYESAFFNATHKFKKGKFMSIPKERCAKIVYEALMIHILTRLAVNLEIDDSDLSPQSVSKMTADRLFSPNNTPKLIDQHKTRLEPLGITTEVLNSYGFLDEYAHLKVAEIVKAAGISRKTIENYRVIAPDQANQVLQLLQNSQNPKLKDAANVANDTKDWVNIGTEGLDGFFANCASLGMNDGTTGNRRDAESGKAFFVDRGFYAPQKGMFDVESIAKAASRHVPIRAMG
jgi:hypothetical protein